MNQVDYAPLVTEYMNGVTGGRIVTGRLARLAVWRQIEDLQHAAERGLWFDHKSANSALNFLSLCNHSKGEWAGTQFQPTQEQIFIIWVIFGWRRKSDNTRRFRNVHIEIARKWGKSFVVSALAVLLLLFDKPIEHGAEGYVAATKEQQAQIVHGEAVRMIQQSPALARQCYIVKNNIAVPALNSYFRPIGSDSDKTDGLNPHFVIRDELHAWSEHQRGLAEKLASGSGARRQPLFITITTAGDDRSVLWQEDHDFAVKVLESVITGNIESDSWFVFIAAIDYPAEYPCFKCLGCECTWCGGTGTIKADDPFDERVWVKSNPSIGITPKWDYMREASDLAQKRAEKLNEWLRYHCNVRVASTERPIKPEMWAACAGEQSELSGRECHGGMDLGRSNDFASVGLMFPISEVDDSGESFTRYEALSWSFTCEERAEEMRSEMVGRWIRDGRLLASFGDTISLGDVRDVVLECQQKYMLHTLAYDPTFAKHLAEELQNDYAMSMFPFTQRPRFYNEPLRKFLALLTGFRVVGGKRMALFRHNGCPVLSWQAGNLVIRRNQQDEWMPAKDASPYKIDAIVALLMAFSECLFAEKSGEWNPGSIRL